MNLSSIQLLVSPSNVVTITVSGEDKVQLYYCNLIEDIYYSYIDYTGLVRLVDMDQYPTSKVFYYLALDV